MDYVNIVKHWAGENIMCTAVYYKTIIFSTIIRIFLYISIKN